MTKEEAAKKIHAFYYEHLKWCGCGDPEGAMRLMRDVLEVINQKYEKNSEVWDVFYLRYSEKLEHLICYISKPSLVTSYFYVLDAAGLLEHGGCVPGWLTDEGKELLQCLKDIGDDFDWNKMEYGE